MAERELRRGILTPLPEIDGAAPKGPRYPNVPADIGRDVVHQATGLVGAIVEWSDAAVVLRDDSGRDHRFRNTPGSFLVGGRPITLVRPTPIAGRVSPPTASGSIATPQAPARVARASRILVEGVHDAELIEKVWGDDLRSEGIVVEPMDGADDVASIVRAFGPREGRRLGILLDHLVEGTKESRLAATIDHPEVLVRGHRFVDVWAAVDPRVVGLDAWPDIPRETSWKDGICLAVTGSAATEPRAFWRRLLGKVDSYRDLDTSLIGAVEELIDFVTAG